MNAEELMKKHQNEIRYKQLYQIKDTKTGFTGAPFEQPNNASALRAFAELVNRNQEVYAHADDYQLYYVGCQNEQTGEIIGAPVFLENAVNVKINKPANEKK